MKGRTEIDYSNLRGRIKERFNSEVVFARKIGISTVSLSFKLNNKTGFLQNEILKICEVLEIDLSEVNHYFFNKKVKKT